MTPEQLKRSFFLKRNRFTRCLEEFFRFGIPQILCHDRKELIKDRIGDVYRSHGLLILAQLISEVLQDIDPDGAYRQPLPGADPKEKQPFLHFTRRTELIETALASRLDKLLQDRHQVAHPDENLLSEILGLKNKQVFSEEEASHILLERQDTYFLRLEQAEAVELFFNQMEQGLENMGWDISNLQFQK